MIDNKLSTSTLIPKITLTNLFEGRIYLKLTFFAFQYGRFGIGLL